MGNPEIRLVVPGARVDDVRPMGEEERHARFTLRGGPGQVRGVAFGVGGTLAKRAAQGPARRERAAGAERVERRHRAARGARDALRPRRGARRTTRGAQSDAEWTERLAAALEGPLPVASVRPTAMGPDGRSPTGRGARWWIGATASGLAVIGELASSGERVLVVCADAIWRRGIVESAVHPGRYAGAEPARSSRRAARSPPRTRDAERCPRRLGRPLFVARPA